MQRRNMLRLLAAATGAAAAGLSLSAAAQGTYPTKPISLVVPFPAGGTTDIVARIVADKLGQQLGQTVVVDNRGGAGGSIGTGYLAKAAPDGYTLGIATASTHGINPAVYPRLSYDATKDFTTITNLASVPNVMSINPAVKANDMKAFIALAKAQPNKMAYGSAGNGSVSHMMGELFKMSSKTELLHVPYKGVGPALNDALANQVQVLFDNLPSSLPFIEGGKLRALAVASPKRVPALPNVPTFAELGLPEVNDAAWFGLIAPANLPADVQAKLHDATVKVLALPEVKAKLEKLGAVPVGNTPAQFAAQIKSEVAKNKRIAAAAKITLD
ncbi:MULTISPECIES: tripartite tricarboxylate transporter substrate binding protein BugE [Cupriavidus]|uniref:Tripartite tricarboxylate transporter substrate binding protein BugE n=1 Tax=Cupriavidus basilensis TaxID=68895 RepID=A0A643G2F2_9BURK|nr:MULTISPECIES: tripartite tricarboxylate transporter substrate binding protein BugE [Cupriavidus]MBB1634645.1 ABC transporter substrate-binding protein [Cupriavidus sp. UME77]MCP3025205.1 tripartite tricarboxylate transporter substrate binding protein BugE [Cupriavidus basilensis]MDR3379490.1 tripartite tricarboxylate transporter substrate binding protein BugE [Cupriavidus basilensis]QOT77606.1 tripartite tricarboxylate transporter substrate binding protein BugE [Cupriavidus basilensis]